MQKSESRYFLGIGIGSLLTIGTLGRLDPFIGAGVGMGLILIAMVLDLAHAQLWDILAAIGLGLIGAAIVAKFAPDPDRWLVGIGGAFLLVGVMTGERMR